MPTLREEYSHQMHMCMMLEASASRLPEAEVLKLLRTTVRRSRTWILWTAPNP